MSRRAPGLRWPCRGVIGLGAALVLAGCASRHDPAPRPETPAPAAPAVIRPAAADAGLRAFERAQADRAGRAEAEGRWADAALAWDVLLLLQPGDEALRQRLATARQRIDQRVQAQLAVADAAQRRGDLAAAAQAHLQVLALDPGRRASADQLRQIELERSRRNLGRALRAQDLRSPTQPARPEVAARANRLREQATVVARQGDVDAAILLLRDSGLWRSDAAVRAQLADLHVQRAEALRARQPQAARAALDAALALDRRHAGALALQQQWQRRKAAGAEPAPAAPAAAAATASSPAPAPAPGSAPGARP